MSDNGNGTSQFTPETARAAGKASAEARRRRRTMSPEERAQEAIASKLGELTSELLDAALGKGDFAPHVVTDGEESHFVPGLKPETRLTAILRAMEWKLGKPATVKPTSGEDKDPEVPTADGLFA